MPIFETDRLLVETGISDDSGRNLRIIGFDNPNAIFGEVLISDVKGVAINYSLNHGRIQETKSLSRAGDLVSHAVRSQSLTVSTDSTP
jgi:hypothetical protein